MPQGIRCFKSQNQTNKKAASTNARKPPISPLENDVRGKIMHFRPRFSGNFQNIIRIEKKGQARRHIISYQVLRSAFIRVLVAGDYNFKDKALDFIKKYSGEKIGIDDWNDCQLAMECLRILNENPSNFMVDVSSVNSAIGTLSYLFGRALSDERYKTWKPGISCEEVISKIVRPNKFSSVGKVVSIITLAYKETQLSSTEEIKYFLETLYDNMNFDTMNMDYSTEQSDMMKKIYEDRLYDKFMSATNATSLFEVCEKFMDLNQ